MPSVVFVCVANSLRSQMAEAFAKSLGRSAWEIWSAGSQPSGRLHPLAIQLMAERGCDLSAHRSKGLTEIPSKRWDYVVTMGCQDACPAVNGRRRIDWKIPDPAGLSIGEARRVRDHIEGLVRRLMSEPPRLASSGADLKGGV
ncbi:MAG: arsenate reductase ArsC [Candidatus Omnitrophica bacterium]|nr:arsenate reductase ArsC [Candidatus Omnitrophota bacterium]